MSDDWYPAIRECCDYWRDATMLQQTLEALKTSINSENDACIDCSKAIVEVVCQLIVDELEDPTAPVRPIESHPTLPKWVKAALSVLKLDRSADAQLRNLVSAHYTLTHTLAEMRNGSGPVSHGKAAFLERLTRHHRQSAVLSADAIVGLLHMAYQDSDLNLLRSREPHTRFKPQNELIDEWTAFSVAEIDGDENSLVVELRLPSDETYRITVTPSEFLYQADREGYVEALNAARSQEVVASELDDENPSNEIAAPELDLEEGA